MKPTLSGKEVTVGPPLWLLAEVTYSCPLHCVFCYNPVDYTYYYHNFRVRTPVIRFDMVHLQGDGTGENLLGVLNTPGVQQYAWSDGPTDVPVADTKGDSIRRAATLSFLAYYEPSGVVVHPSDWEKIELTKNQFGSYLMAVSMQLGAEARIWRIPVIDTPAMPEGTALVGAFGTGAQLYDREQATIRISEQHADFFVRNAVVILAEQRLALATKRPESFVQVTFA